MNNKASAPSTNTTKKCRALFPYFPSSEGRLADEHTVRSPPSGPQELTDIMPKNVGRRDLCICVCVCLIFLKANERTENYKYTNKINCTNILVILQSIFISTLTPWSWREREEKVGWVAIDATFNGRHKFKFKFAAIRSPGSARSSFW
jgi:hypothetical protein